MNKLIICKERITVTQLVYPQNVFFVTIVQLLLTSNDVWDLRSKGTMKSKLNDRSISCLVKQLQHTQIEHLTNCNVMTKHEISKVGRIKLVYHCWWPVVYNHNRTKPSTGNNQFHFKKDKSNNNNIKIKHKNLKSV